MKRVPYARKTLLLLKIEGGRLGCLKNQKNCVVPKNPKTEPFGFFSAFASINTFQKRRRGDPLGCFIIQLVAIKITKKGTSKNSGKKSDNVKKTVTANLLSCPVTTKALKTTIARGGTLCKHPKLLCKKVGRPRENL